MDFKYSPILYNVEDWEDGHGFMLHESVRLYPVKMSVNNKVEPPSTASITIDEHSPGIKVGQYLLVKSPVATEMMYVKSISTDYINGNQRTLSCEGIFGLMSDAIVVGKLTPNTIDNRWSKKASNNRCFCADAVQEIIKTVNDAIYPSGSYNGYRLFKWNPEDTFGYANIKQGWSFNNVSCMTAMNDITDCLQDSEWQITFDAEHGQILLNLIKQRTDANCELRESRNCKSLKVTVDRKDYYSIVYPTGKKDAGITSASDVAILSRSGNIIHSKGNAYITNVYACNTWGRVAVHKSDNTKSGASDICDWAVEELIRNSTPRVNISVDALELSQLTGSTIDEMKPGNRCRIPLPQYGVQFEDRIVECSFSDLVADDYSCKLTISNERKSIKDVLYQTSGGGGGKKKDAETESEICGIDKKAINAQADIDGLKTDTTITIGGVTGYFTRVYNESLEKYVYMFVKA